MLGVTNRLIEAAGAAKAGRSTDVREIRQTLFRLHSATLDDLVSEKGVRVAALHDMERSFSQHFDETTDRIASHRTLSDRDLDVISSAGERWSSRLLAAHMEDKGVDGQLFEADTVVVTDEMPGNARPLLPQTRSRVESTLVPALERGAIPVVTGFFGSSESGLLTTLGRGGTDLTAAVLGACVDASEILLWKVEHSALPGGGMQWEPGWEGVVHDALPHVCIPQLSYEEAGALAHLGKKVLHPDTVLPAIELGIPIGVRNTLNPSNPCTMISAYRPRPDSAGSRPVARLRTVTSVSVSAYEARHKTALAVDWPEVLPPGLVGKSEAGLVALVGNGASRLAAALLPRVRSVLRAAGVHSIVPLPIILNPHALVVVVPEAQRKVALRALHGAFAPEFDVDFDIDAPLAEGAASSTASYSAAAASPRLFVPPATSAAHSDAGMAPLHAPSREAPLRAAVA